MQTGAVDATTVSRRTRPLVCLDHRRCAAGPSWNMPSRPAPRWRGSYSRSWSGVAHEALDGAAARWLRSSRCTSWSASAIVAFLDGLVATSMNMNGYFRLDAHCALGVGKMVIWPMSVTRQFTGLPLGVFHGPAWRTRRAHDARKVHGLRQFEVVVGHVRDHAWMGSGGCSAPPMSRSFAERNRGVDERLLDQRLGRAGAPRQEPWQEDFEFLHGWPSRRRPAQCGGPSIVYAATSRARPLGSRACLEAVHVQAPDVVTEVRWGCASVSSFVMLTPRRSAPTCGRP